MVWRVVRATMVNIRGKVYRRLGSDETACKPLGAPHPLLMTSEMAVRRCSRVDARAPTV